MEQGVAEGPPRLTVPPNGSGKAGNGRMVPTVASVGEQSRGKAVFFGHLSVQRRNERVKTTASSSRFPTS